MTKTALVISGGGSKGAFAVGAIEVLNEHGIRFDLVTGTSTGALVAPLVATGELALLRTIYTTVHTDDILRQRSGIDILTGDAIHDTKPLWQLINQHMSAALYTRLLACPIDVFVCATSLQDGKAYYFNPKRGRDGKPLSRDTFNRAIFASASEPVLMPSIRVPQDADVQYVDGGVREVVPLRKAIEQGADEVFAIVLAPEERQQHPDRSYVSVVDTLLRTLDIMLQEVAQEDLAGTVRGNEWLAHMQAVRERAARYVPADKLDEVFAASPGVRAELSKRPITLHLIRPELDLPTGGLRFDPPVMSAMMQMGREAAERCVRAL